MESHHGSRTASFILALILGFVPAGSCRAQSVPAPAEPAAATEPVAAAQPTAAPGQDPTPPPRPLSQSPVGAEPLADAPPPAGPAPAPVLSQPPETLAPRQEGASPPPARPEAAVPSPTPSEKDAPEKAVTDKSVASSGLRLAARPSAYLTAQQRVIHQPFVAQGGAPLTLMPWPGTGTPLREFDGGGKASWDVAEVDSDAAAAACAAGQLEKIDPAILAKATDGTGAEKDFIAGGLQPCSVASVVWSSLIAFNPKAWPAPAAARGAKRAKTAPQATGPRAPAALADVFDVAAFPGKRALRKAPVYLLEMSLLAAGVAPDAVYAELATEAGTARAFARLEALRGHVVWLDTPARAAQALADHKAVMAMLYSGRAFQTAGVEGKALGLLWDGQIYHLDAWVIAKGTPNVDKARAFVAFASEPLRQAGVAEQFPYGPARLSATAKVGSHPVLKAAMAAYLPTAPAHLRSALRFDGAFWAEHERRLTERFEAWLQAPLAKPVSTTPDLVVPPAEEPVKTGDGGKSG